MAKKNNELEKAIEDLKEEYRAAAKKEWIRDPMAWALYQVWKKYNRRVS